MTVSLYFQGGSGECQLVRSIHIVIEFWEPFEDASLPILSYKIYLELEIKYTKIKMACRPPFSAG